MSSNESKKVNAVLILEVLGRPKEYLVETLNEIAKKISVEKGVKLIDSKVNEPVLMKDQKDFYSSFSEVEVETENVLYLAILMFKYMPAHIDVLSPQNISLSNSEWNDILNELTRRLHGYEEIARMLQTEKSILENKFRVLTAQNVKVEEIKPAEKKQETKKKIKKGKNKK